MTPATPLDGRSLVRCADHRPRRWLMGRDYDQGRKVQREVVLNETFGRISVFSGYRSPLVNQTGNEKGLNCASNESNYASHIFDHKDKDGKIGATASIVIPWFADQYQDARDWQSLAWWIHDNLPHCGLCFFPSLAAFNITWHESNKEKSI